MESLVISGTQPAFNSLYGSVGGDRDSHPIGKISLESDQGQPINFFERYGARLISNGYTPIPIQPRTKLPGSYANGAWYGLKAWSGYLSNPPSKGDLEQWAAWPEAGVGLLTGNIIGIDVDIIDIDLASAAVNKADEIFGASPLMRIGQEPKALLVYRVSQSLRKRAVGSKGKLIEILGFGQQFVAYGIHPYTKQPYRWPSLSPLQVPARDLPIVTAATLDKFLEAVG